MSFDKRTLVLPEGTIFEEHTIVAKGDFILGNHVTCGFGVDIAGRVFTGQGASLTGDIRCGGDLRLDQSSNIEGEIECGADAYLGERCFVKGDLALEGDLDVGDDVRIGGQLKAKGWVNKRNPVPMVIYIFIYLLELLRLGQSDEVERILKELEDVDDGDIAVDEMFLFVPDHSTIGLQKSEVKGDFDAGDDCRILGNWTVKGKAQLADGCHLFGALRAEGDVTLGLQTQVQGDVTSGGHVTVGTGSQVLGNLQAKSVTMYPDATVDGKILATDGVNFETESQARKTATEKVKEMDGKAADLVDLLG